MLVTLPVILYKRIEEHKSQASAVGLHTIYSHNIKKPKLRDCFLVLKNCSIKFDCLIYEMRFIRDKSPEFTHSIKISTG